MKLLERSDTHDSIIRERVPIYENDKALRRFCLSAAGVSFGLLWEESWSSPLPQFGRTPAKAYSQDSIGDGVIAPHWPSVGDSKPECPGDCPRWLASRPRLSRNR